MTRSSRRTSIVGVTTCPSEKRDKQFANRACRHALRVALAHDATGDEVLPTLRDVSNPWTMDKDGKQWIGGRWPSLLRK